MLHDARSSADLFHFTVGSGLPVIALHGGPGWDHSYLRPAIDPLTDQCEVTYVDLPGNGRSRHPASPEEWQALTLEHLVEAVDRVRVAVGHDAVVLLGHSFGGAVAQEFTLRHPERTLGLVLVATYPAFDFTPSAAERAQRRATPAEWAALQTAFAALLPDVEVVVLERSGHFPFLEQPKEWERRVRDWLGRRIGTVDANAARTARGAAASGGA